MEEPTPPEPPRARAVPAGGRCPTGDAESDPRARRTGLAAVDGADRAARRPRARGRRGPRWSTSRRRCSSASRSTDETLPPGLSIADTVVQDVGFVLAAVYCAQLGGRVRALVAVRPAPPRRRLAPGGRRDRAAAGRVRRAQRRLVGDLPPRRREAAESARVQRRHGAAAAQRGADVRGRADLRGVPVPRLHLHRAAQLARDAARGADHGAAVRRRARRIGAGARPRAARRARLRAVPAVPLHGFAVPVHRRPLAQQLGRVREPRGLGLAGAGADRRLAAGDRGGRARRSSASA